MKQCAFFLLAVSVLLAPAYFTQTEPDLIRSASSLVVRTEVNSPCLAERAVSSKLETLSSAQSHSDQETAQTELIHDAMKSPECRKLIVTAILRAMNQPNVDLRHDTKSFYLWHYGSEILASLKAEEALDLLIEHFDLDDGTPFPLNHHPALVSVITMGSIAIPKLESVLMQNGNPNSRQYAVFCLASIGGSGAKKVLVQALASESNKCVSSFIKASLDGFKTSKLHDQIGADSRTDWYAAFLCNAQ